MPDAPLDKIAFQFERDEERDANIFVRWGFSKVAGNVTRAYVDLELEVDGYRFTVLHYDNSHGQVYHRHSPGFPHSGSLKTDLSTWLSSRWVSDAKDEILANWRFWINSVVPSDVKGYVRNLRDAGQGAVPAWSEDQD